MKSSVLVIVFLFFLNFSFSTLLCPDHHLSEPPKTNPLKTAIWLKLNPDSKVKKILNRIKQYHISLIFLHTSKKNLARPEEIKSFISRVQTECPDTQIFPWISVVIRSPVIFKTKNLIHAFILFLNQTNLPGLHLDFEPPFGSQTFEYLEEYFLFLSTIKNRLKPTQKKLSIAVFPRMLRIFFEKNPQKRKHLQFLSKNIDQYVLMMYDTGIREESEFLNHMVSHINFINRLINRKEGQEIYIGIASYGWHSNKIHKWMHDPGIENIKTSVLSLKQYQNLHPGEIKINGFAIFRYGTINKTEWEEYSRLIQ